MLALATAAAALEHWPKVDVDSVDWKKDVSFLEAKGGGMGEMKGMQMNR